MQTPVQLVLAVEAAPPSTCDGDREGLQSWDRHRILVVGTSSAEVVVVDIVVVKKGMDFRMHVGHSRSSTCHSDVHDDDHVGMLGDRIGVDICCIFGSGKMHYRRRRHWRHTAFAAAAVNSQGMPFRLPRRRLPGKG